MILEIKKIGINGEGIAYYQRKPVFISGGLVGEVVDVNITQEFDKYYVGELVAFKTKSKSRVEVNCDKYNQCGGCSLLHSDYSNQLEIKKEQIKESFKKYCDKDIEVIVNPSMKQYHYRNSLKLPFCYLNGKISCGIYKTGTNNVVPIEKCLIHEELLEDIKCFILSVINKYDFQVYDQKTKSGLRFLYLRTIGKRVQVCIITGNNVLEKAFVNEIASNKYIISIYQSINVRKGEIFGSKMLYMYGQKHLNFKYDDLKLKLSLKSFYQLNTLQAKRLYSKIIEFIPKNMNLLVEAYSGIGVMSLLLSKYFNKIIAVESIGDAVINGKSIASSNNINNIEHIKDDFKYALKNINEDIDVLLVDPPRSGLDDEVLNIILTKNIKYILYVSCNPATLSKNINILKKNYKLQKIECFDMFPNTSHVETVVLLEKKPQK